MREPLAKLQKRRNSKWLWTDGPTDGHYRVACTRLKTSRYNTPEVFFFMTDDDFC